MGAHRNGRVTTFVIDPRRLKIPVGRYYKGEIEPVRRAIKKRAKHPTYVYIELPMKPFTLVLSSDPIEREGLDLIGAYGPDVTTGMLKEDLPYSSAR